MLEVYGDRSVVWLENWPKSMKNINEEKISELLESIAETPLKGECLLIVEGTSQDVEEKDEEDLFSEIQSRIQQGMKKKIKLLRKLRNSTSE